MKAYHISPTKNRQSILRNGLTPNSKKEGRIKYENRLFFSIDKEDLGFDFVNFENVDCWEFEIDPKIMKPDNYSGSTNHFYIFSKIPANKIRLAETF